MKFGPAGMPQLGRVPSAPVNDYRSGEKLLLDKVVPADLTVEVTIDFQGNTKSRDAGLLFRTTGGPVGYDAQRGYFAGLIPATGRVILGKHDGRTWTEITRADVAFDPVELQRLGVTVVNDRIVVLWLASRF